MIGISLAFDVRQRPATITAWHLCTVIIPRRTITGRLVRGQVWRRHDGRRCTKNLSVRQSASRPNWRRRAMAKTPSNLHEHQDGGSVEAW